MNTSSSHLVVIRFSAMGDVAMLVPLFRCFYNQYPNIKITLVTRSSYVPLFQEFSTLSFFTPSFDHQHKGILGLYRLYTEILSLKPNAIADVHQVLRTYQLSFYFLFNPFIRFRKLNKGRAEKRALIRAEQKSVKPLTPQIYRYAEVFRKLGFPIDLESHIFPPKLIINKSIKLPIHSSNRKWVGVAPFAAHKGKVYPLDLMQKVVAYLQQKHDIILFGKGIEETQLFTAWSNAYPNVHFFTDDYALSDELSVLSNLDLMIAMDSANGHMAANFNIPVLTLWGMTHPFLGFTPFNQPIENNIMVDRKAYPKIPTSVYGNIVPYGYENAMRSITPESVIVKANKILK